MGDNSCDLECVKKLPAKPKIHEFIGTVKILLVDTPASEYLRKRINAGLITLAYMMMGAAVMNVLFFTLTFQLGLFMNLHIMLCTLGFQLCIPCGMLIINSLGGSSNILKISDRRIEHLFLQFFGLGLGCAGTVLAILSKFLENQNFITIHAISGMVASGFGGLTMLLGPLLFFTKSRWIIYPKRVHMFFGAMCLIASSVSFISGVHRYCIYSWLSVKHMPIFLYLFCFLYTAIIIKNVFMSMLNNYAD